MIVMSRTTPDVAQSDRIADAARHMYDGEVALHAARQSHVDVWITAANDKLNAAIAEHTAALLAA